MKEWQKLLDYIDDYIYLQSENKIIIRHGDTAQRAQEVYQYIINKYELQENEIWMFDVALDLIRKKQESDRINLKNDIGIYSIYRQNCYEQIRDTYFRKLIVKAGRFSLETDRIEKKIQDILHLIFTILCPNYDYRNIEIVKFYDSDEYGRLYQLYGMEYPSVFQVIDEQICVSDNNLTSEKAIGQLKELICEQLGMIGFKRIVVEALAEHRKEFNRNRSSRRDFMYILNESNVELLYPLTYKQLLCLERISLPYKINSFMIRSVQECQSYINDNLGLKEIYVDALAECMFWAYDPISTEEWKNMGLSSMIKSFIIVTFLEGKGINNLGQLASMNYKEILDISTIDFANEIVRDLGEYGIKLSKDDTE